MLLHRVRDSTREGKKRALVLCEVPVGATDLVVLTISVVVAALRPTRFRRRQLGVDQGDRQSRSRLIRYVVTAWTVRWAQIDAIVDTMSDADGFRFCCDASTMSFIDTTPCSCPSASTTGTRRTLNSFIVASASLMLSSGLHA